MILGIPFIQENLLFLVIGYLIRNCKAQPFALINISGHYYFEYVLNQI